MTKWTGEIEALCEKLRINCVNLSEYHRKRYYHFKAYGKYFRLPMIVLASINSTASVGLQPVLEQPIISAITCLIGMMMGIIGAIELYMGIQSSMELELKQSKEFYSLAIDIYKTLSLKRDNRGEDGKDYLNTKYGVYTKLCEASNLLKRQLKIDLLTEIPEQYIDKKRMITSPNFGRAKQHKNSEYSDDEHFHHEEASCCDRFSFKKNPVNAFRESDNLQLYNFPNHAQETTSMLPMYNVEQDFGSYPSSEEGDIESQSLQGNNFLIGEDLLRAMGKLKNDAERKLIQEQGIAPKIEEMEVRKEEKEEKEEKEKKVKEEVVIQVSEENAENKNQDNKANEP